MQVPGVADSQQPGCVVQGQLGIVFVCSIIQPLPMSKPFKSPSPYLGIAIAIAWTSTGLLTP